MATPLPAQISVATQHNDNARTGLNPNETLLTTTTLKTNHFGRLFAQRVDDPFIASTSLECAHYFRTTR